MGKPVRTPFSRVFTIEDRAGPAQTPIFQAGTRAMGASWSFGDRTPIREPDPSRYGGFRIIDAIKADRGLPMLPLEARYQFALSEFLRIARKGCPIDVQVHIGQCQDPRDFNAGWDKIFVLEGGDLSNWSTSELGTQEQGGDAVVNESIDLNGLDAYEIGRIVLGELGASQILTELKDITICDAVTCGACGLPSNGCQRFFAIEVATAGSPGIAPTVIWSQDGGTTINAATINSAALADDTFALTCVGAYVVVVDKETGNLSHHYAKVTDILTAVAAPWTKVSTGYVASKGPNDIFSLGAALTWIVGDGGYVYFTDDVTSQVVVQNAGVATAQNLNCIHGADELNLIAGGAANALIRTTNGGDTWALISTMPVAQAAVAINAVWMRSANEWFAAYNNGKLYYTRDAGLTWTEKTFPGSGAGVCRDIKFSTPTVGYLAHNTATPAGRILRTINGGQSWYVAPEGSGSIPANDLINAVAVSGECPNVVYGAGLADNANDGFLVKGAN